MPNKKNYRQLFILGTTKIYTTCCTNVDDDIEICLPQEILAPIR